MTLLADNVLASVDGFGITTPDLPATVDDVITAAKDDRPFSVFTLNLDHLVKLRRNFAFRAAYHNAEIVTADGAPVAWLARFQNRSITRTTGADLMAPLAEAAAAAHLPVYLFGTSAGVIAKAARELSDRTEGALDIAGTYAPSQNFNPVGPEADLTIERIRNSGARLCFVALGAPKQELFAEHARQRGLNCGMVCIGASLDFLAGAQIRAPQVMRDYGFEWVWRLASNPRRLARRYAECALVFADLTLLTLLRERFTRLKA
jgi:exopolysaccharide biosynthesis WecB/TagA/CpsF family protein